MKTTILSILVLLAATVTLSAQETVPTATTTKPDYSKPALQRFVLSIPEQPKRNRNVRFYVGGIEFGAIGTRWRFNYLPIMAPLSGTRLGITQEWPDPFALTGTTIATPPRAWRTQRNVSSELKRIEKTERAKIKVNMK